MHSSHGAVNQNCSHVVFVIFGLGNPTYWFWWNGVFLPATSALFWLLFTIPLFIISGRILFGVNIFGCIYCTWWWRPYCKMMDRWSWKLITSLIYCRAVLKSFNSAWCGIATFFMFRQQLLVQILFSEQNAQCASCAHGFPNLIWIVFVLCSSRLR